MRIMPLLESQEYAGETVIIEEGAWGDSMYIIVEGTVRVSRKEKGGEEIIISYLYGGSYFGEFSLIDRMPRSASVIAVKPTRTLRLNKVDFDDLLLHNIALANAFYKNCLEETFARFRNNLANFTFSQHLLKEKSYALDEINKDLSAAAKVQRYFIDTEHLDNEQSVFHHIRHSYIYVPTIDIGGDFLNIVRIDEYRLAIVIADFMGHGITAALGTGVLKSAMSIFMGTYGLDPVKLMEELNRHFLEVIPRLYATCYYALIDVQAGKMKVAKAGHPHPLFWSSGKQEFVTLNSMGTGLGLVKDPHFTLGEIPISPGDKILFYTDGIIEQHSRDNEMYSPERLQSLFEKLVTGGEKRIVKRIHEDLQAFANDEQFEDDVTLLLLEG